MKKLNKANKLLINTETVRNLDTNQMQGVVAGAALADYSNSAQSAGPSLPGPSHSTQDIYFGGNVYVYGG